MRRSDRAEGISFNSFFDVADWMKVKQCDERRRFGKCKCVAKRRPDWNPCDYAQKRIDNAMARGMGESLPNDLTIEDLIHWATRRQCDKSKQGGVCGHKGCAAVEGCSEFLNAELSRMKKAG